MSYSNWLKTLVFSTLLSFAGGLAAQNQMTLEDCIAYAQANHPELKIAQLKISDAEWQIKENTATGLPQVTVGISYTGFIQRGGLPSSALSFGGGGAPPPQSLIDGFENAGIDGFFDWFGGLFASDPDSKLYFAPVHSVAGELKASQLLFSNSYRLAKKAARYYRDYVAMSLNTTRRTVRNQVIDAYLPALLIADNVKILDKNIGNLEKLIGETREVNKAGFAEQLDVDRLELSISTLKSERENLVRQQEIVVNALKLMMGMAIAENIQPSDNLDALLTKYADADLTTELNPMTRPEYTTLLKARELQNLQIEIYNKPWMPNVVGFAQYQPQAQGGFGDKNSDTHKDWYFIPSAVGGISITANLFDSGVSKAKKQRAVVALQTLDEQKRMLENAFQLELANARKQYMNADARVKNQQRNLDLARKIYDTTQTKFKAGLASSFELVSAESALYQAEQTLMSARHELLTARTAIRKALGQE